MEPDDVTNYVKLRPKQFPPRELRETAEGKYWKSFQYPFVTKQIGGVTSLNYCESRPYHLAVTASTRVIVYDKFMGINRTFSRFKDKAYCGTFRSDGKLVAAGGEDGLVQIFDANSRSILRQLSGHRRPVHAVTFSPDKLHLLSGGDDASVRWWDITTGVQVARMDGHTDYVRVAAVSPVSHHVLATGGYDHICKLWDSRTQKAVTTVHHGSPIESLAFFPSESILVTAGGTQLCCWDLLSGGRLLHKFVAHQKTITSVHVQQMHHSGSLHGVRIVSASLDGHMKVFDPESFKLTHATKYPSPILSLALASDMSSLAVGMADGTLSIKRRKSMESGSSRTRYAPRLTAASYKYFVRGQSTKAAATDLVMARQQKIGLASYDRYLRRFRYREALDAALETNRAEIVSAVVEELVSRGALGPALGGRDVDSLLPLLKHISKYISDPRYTHNLCALSHRILDLYAFPSDAPGLLSTLSVLYERVAGEIQVQDDLMSIKGMLDSVLSVSSIVM